MKISMYKPKPPKKGLEWPPMKLVHIDFEEKGISDTFLVRYNYEACEFQWIGLSEVDPDDVHGSQEWSCIDWQYFLDLDTPENCRKHLKEAPTLMAALGKCF